MNNEIAIKTSDLSTTIATFEKIKELAEYLAKSSTFTSGYELKGKDGKVLIDEETGLAKVNTTDIAISLLAGHELGIDIAGSLLLGKKLNTNTYLAITKGREIGIGLSTALEKIVSIPTKNGPVTYTMVDIISAKLIQNQIEFLPFVRNYAPFYMYYDFKSKEELDLDRILDENDDLKPEYFLVDANATADQAKEAVSSGKKMVIRSRNGYFTKAKFVRKYPNGGTVIHYQRFSTLDAQRAGLLPTYDEKGVLISNGKDNWIANTPQMMANRVISVGGRIIGADLLHGIYTKDELIDANIITKDDKVIDAQVEVIN